MNLCNTTKLLKVYERKTWVLVLIITVPLAAIKNAFQFDSNRYCVCKNEVADDASVALY